MEQQGKEYKFTVFIYPLTAEEAEALRAQVEAALLEMVSAAGKFMSPVDVEANDGNENAGTD